MIAYQNLLGEADCLVRAYRSASTALCALVRIDFVDVALRDSANGALIDTCTASNAVITNYVSHNNKMFIVNTVLLIRNRSTTFAVVFLLFCKDSQFPHNTHQNSIRMNSSHDHRSNAVFCMIKLIIIII